MPLIVPDRDDWFEPDYGLPRAQWAAIGGWIRAFASEDDQEDAWEQCARIWLARLRAGLGGEYALSESEHFHLLSEEPEKARSKTLAFLEEARRHFNKVLQDITPEDWKGKHVILRFSEMDDYDAYVSHFMSDGEFAGSGGMFLHKGYMHIAYPAHPLGRSERPALVHELTHNLLAHLPLPAWLNEALAMAFEEDLTGRQDVPLGRELGERHRAWWDETTIQEFWRGESFHSVEGQELSYSLARILLSFIHTDLRPPPLEFRRFVLRACWDDAGAVACREHLDIELGDLAAGFLGPGNWQPQVNLWKRETHPRPEPEPDELDDDCQ